MPIAAAILTTRSRHTHHYEVWERYTVATSHYQAELSTMVIAIAPQLREISELNRDLQSAMAKRHQLRYLHLLEHEPERLSRTPVSALWLSQFSWSEDDDAMLASSSPIYAGTISEVEALAARNNGHPLWPEARRTFFDKIETSEAYRVLRDKHLAELETIAEAYRMKARQQEN